jgi:hypothetical protein|tara:strand:+ start:97 stop:1125 length:1029 start_codon:yes stop_codon:yes gene_type:complete
MKNLRINRLQQPGSAICLALAMGVWLFFSPLVGQSQSVQIPSYQGESKLGLPHGEGTFTWASGNVYDGSWVSGKRQGSGTFTWASGTRYVGDWHQDRQHGEGWMVWANGTQYSGQWVYGHKEGHGTLTIVSGANPPTYQIFEGIFLNDHPVDGMYILEDGTEIGLLIEGQFVPKPQPCVVRKSDTQIINMQMVQIEICEFSSGNRYEGQMVDNLYQGHGVFTWANGALYVGEWHHGKQDGRGTLIFADGGRYLGDWAQGLRHGQGAMDWVDGRKYFGQWARGKQQGVGSLVLTSGGSYNGEWRNGQKWSGANYDQDNKILSVVINGVENTSFMVENVPKLDN